MRAFSFDVTAFIQANRDYRAAMAAASDQFIAACKASSIDGQFPATLFIDVIYEQTLYGLAGVIQHNAVPGTSLDDAIEVFTKTINEARDKVTDHWRAETIRQAAEAPLS